MDASYALVGAAALAAGAVNAIAGGGSLLSFPALVGAGLQSVAASITNTVALCPGYLGAAVAQRAQLAGQRRRLAVLLPAAALGGGLGAYLLLRTGEAAFDVVVPFLLVFAAALLGFQEHIKRALITRKRRNHESLAAIPVGLAAVYGGYFGAGMGVIVLAVLAVALDDDLTRINALKQMVSLVVNVTAAAVFLIRTDVDWGYAPIMAVASLAGGAIGGRVASRVPPQALRATVVVVALVVAARYAYYALF